MIRLQHVTKLYGLVIGVNDVTFDLPQGAYGLLGPNGSGKTTLLNLLMGQLRPTLGTVQVLGHEPWNNLELLRHVGLCPERDDMYPSISGLDWVRYLMELHGFDRRQARLLAENALVQVGLADAMRRSIGGYSRGMRQRVKLAQAIAHGPQLLILDEPFNGLDPLYRHEMTLLLKNWAKGGGSLILASHILHEVEAITDSFLLICNGRVLASGSAEEVHSMLADVPNEITFRCSDAAALARAMLGQEHRDVVESVRFSTDNEELVLATKRAAVVYEHLPAWLAGSGVRVREMRSADESLQALFDSLLRIHRGER